MMIFVDTSALYAYLVRTDRHHLRAVDAFNRLLATQAELVTTNYTLVETTALLQNRLGLDAVRAFYSEFVPLLRVDWVLEDDHTRAAEAVLLAARRKLSLVDCVNFRCMRRLQVRAAFAFDEHFREQGFTVVPQPE